MVPPVSERTSVRSFETTLLGSLVPTTGARIARREPSRCGFFLYWHDWHLFGSFSEWTRSRFGEVLAIGALAALAAFGIGIFGTRPLGLLVIAVLGMSIARYV